MASRYEAMNVAFRLAYERLHGKKFEEHEDSSTADLAEFHMDALRAQGWRRGFVTSREDLQQQFAAASPRYPLLLLMVESNGVATWGGEKIVFGARSEALQEAFEVAAHIAKSVPAGTAYEVAEALRALVLKERAKVR